MPRLAVDADPGLGGHFSDVSGDWSFDDGTHLELSRGLRLVDGRRARLRFLAVLPRRAFSARRMSSRVNVGFERCSVTVHSGESWMPQCAEKSGCSRADGSGPNICTASGPGPYLPTPRKIWSEFVHIVAYTRRMRLAQV